MFISFKFNLFILILYICIYFDMYALVVFIDPIVQSTVVFFGFRVVKAERKQSEKSRFDGGISFSWRIFRMFRIKSAVFNN